MKCLNHSEDAVAVCVHCGRAVCPECLREAPTTTRTTCTAACADAARREEIITELLYSKTVAGYKVVGTLCVAGGLIFGALGVYGQVMRPTTIDFFAIGMAITLLVGGAAVAALAHKKQTAGVPDARSRESS